MSRRLTVGYALAVTITVLIALATGYWLLERALIGNVAQLLEAENVEVMQDLASPMEAMPEVDLLRHMKSHAAADEDLFFFQIHDDNGRVLFRSPSLGDSVLPDPPAGGSRWTIDLPPHGRVYIADFPHGHLRLQIGSRLEPTERLLGKYRQVSAGLAVVVGAVSLALGYGISRIALRPLRDISATARRIGAGNLGERIPVPPGRDEVAELVRLLNTTFDRLEAAFKQVRQFSADASHELRTPLTLVRLNAERLQARVTGDAEAAGLADNLFEAIAQMNRLIEGLLFLAKAEGGVLPLVREPHDTAAFMQSIAEDAAVLAEDGKLRFFLERNDAGVVSFDPNLVRQLLFNLISNAVSVVPEGGAFTLASFRAGDRWWIEVRDEGPGLPGDQLERVFERFIRLPRPNGVPDNSGHGLGLAISRGIARLHGGEIRASNRTDRRGLVMTVELPV
jgi:signal transduction histidine kinase